MAITVYPVTPSFAAEIGDVDLEAPIDPTDLRGIKDAFTQYAVLLFPDQHLSQDQHLDFARYFGPLETTIAVYRKDAALRLRKEFADVSNLNHENEVWGKQSRLRSFQLGNRLWHTDSSFKRVPARASLLYARSIRRSADIPNSPMSAPRTMRFPRRRNAVSIAWWPSIQSSTLVRGSASPISAMRSGGECRRCLRWSCARSLNPGANRSTSRRTPVGSSACPSTRVAH